MSINLRTSNASIAGQDLHALQTEAINPRTIDLDTLSSSELVAVLHAENHLVASAVDEALPEIIRAIEVAALKLSSGGRLFFVGAGTSGRLGVLDASECPPTFGTPPEMVQGIIAGGDFALRNAVEGAEDSVETGIRDMTERNLTSNDLVVAIAASGRTPYAIGALRAAKRVGAGAIALVNVRPSAMDSEADFVIAAVTGPEPLTGSTRLKAGTAQKMVLNLISTGTMTLLGKTYGNLMVDVRATNVKLRDRAARIVMSAANVNRELAVQALQDCEWNAKQAIVLLLAEVSSEEATERLARNSGRVREALNEPNS